MLKLHELDFTPDDLTVRISEMLVATVDGADAQIDDTVPEVLQLLRDRLRMDVVFVSEFVDGRRVFRQVAQAPGVQLIAPGDSDPLEESWCQRVVDGRLPQLMTNAATHPTAAGLPSPVPIGAHISTPIVLKSGEVYGTLCCFSQHANEQLTQRDLKNLQYTAQLAAQKLDRKHKVVPMPASVPDWTLQSTHGGSHRH